MIDMEQKLYDIITKHSLDSDFPNYRKKFKAERLIRKWMAQWSASGQRVLVLFSNRMDMRALENFSWENDKIVYQVVSNEEDCQKALNGFWDVLVIGSLNNTFYIENVLYRENKEFINIYERFHEEEGLLFEIEWWELGGLYSKDSDYMFFYGDFGGRDYGIAACLHFNRLIRRIQSENITAELKRRYVRDCIFLLVYKKNFTLLGKYIDYFNNQIEEEDCTNYRELQDDVCNMLADLEKEFSSREHKDIIFYWIDSIDYYEKEKYPYVKTLEDKCLSFENMYTVTGMTSPTYKALFYQLREVSDLGFTQDTVQMESRVFATLEKAGYDIKIVSGYLKKDRRYWTNVNLGSCSMAGEVLWETIKSVMNNKKPVFCLAHLFPETHSPYMCFDLEGNIGDSSYSKARSIFEQSELLKLYDNIICGGNATKIYMSDHGRAELTSRHHTFFYVRNKNIIGEKYYEMTTLLDFYKIVEELIKNGKISTEGLAREFVPIESLVYYNRERIKNILRDSTPIDVLSMGYTGIVTKDMLYLKISTGVEYLGRKGECMLQPYLFKCPMNICDDTGLSYFRERTLNYPLELNESNVKFKYSRYLYKAIELMDIKKTEQFIEIVNEWFMTQADNSVIIRTGGYATREVLRLLKRNAMRKILGIADGNMNCVCSEMGFPIIEPHEIVKKSGITVFITSFPFRDILKAELEGRDDLTVVDLYDLMDRNGIRFSASFFEILPLEHELKVADEVKEKIQFPE